MSDSIPTDHSSEADRRIAMRYFTHPETCCYLRAVIDNDPWLVHVRNISTGGISLLADRHFEAGEQLTVELQNPLKKVKHRVQVRVVYVLEHPNGNYIVGGAFLTPLTGDQLQAFL